MIASAISQWCGQAGEPSDDQLGAGILLAELCLNVREQHEATVALGVRSESHRKAWLNNVPMMRTINGGMSSAGTPSRT